MRIALRPATDADAEACGRICYEAFSQVAERHNFPIDWRDEDLAVKVIEGRLAHEQTYGVVAEVSGEIVGSAFLKTYRPIGAIGPVTVSPRIQGGQVGRAMMENLLERGREKNLSGTRLVQAAYNTRSLALYTKLGFEVREMLVCLLGPPIGRVIRGRPVRLGTKLDIDACKELCTRLHGYARSEDLAEALQLRMLMVVERDSRISGYSTGIHFRGHTVTETEEDARALISAADDLPEPGLLVPARYGTLLRWALDHGLKITQPLSLMSRGVYQTPGGIFLPSIHA
jgi:ribosomal protein S18 acetylase RimI-like enzyme